MGKQSTRHRYKTRGQKNRDTARAVRFVLLGLAVVGIALLVRYVRAWWPYYRTYFE